MNVQSIIGSKGTTVATIEQVATLADAVARLEEHGIGALVVSGDGRAIEGIVSERDVVRAAARAGVDSLRATVGSVMSTDVITCALGDGVDRLMSLMTERRIRHLPVVDDRGHLAGIVSIGDVVKARLTELEQENQALSQYISGH
jgi:CBS domain-containing protein